VTEPLADVADLDAFRQRRNVRRAAAVALVAAAALATYWRVRDSWRLLEGAIRRGAELLGDDDVDA
jgi:hypothetical protein